jgi:hypothetical protein
VLTRRTHKPQNAKFCCFLRQQTQRIARRDDHDRRQGMSVVDADQSRNTVYAAAPTVARNVNDG